MLSRVNMRSAKQASSEAKDGFYLSEVQFNYEHCLKETVVVSEA